jgi:hypothetical protein
MDAAADILREDAPPESGVRRVRPAPEAEVRSAELVAEVAGEVCAEVFALVHVLQPLQGSWSRFGVRTLGTAALTALVWPGRCPVRILRERWPELVPGYAALDRLAWLIVDRLCPPAREPRRGPGR